MVDIDRRRVQRWGATLFAGLGLLGLASRAPAAEDIILGMSAALSGPSRGLGIELWRGAQAYFDGLNERGGIEGRRVSIRLLDDAYDPERAIENTEVLLQDEDVVALFSFVGTPTTTRSLPLVRLYDLEHRRQALLFFPFTGAQPPRHEPYGSYVFNLRASYRRETAGLVENFVRVGRKKIGIFYQADAYGRSGWDGVRRAAEKYGAELVGEATYLRGDDLEDDFSRQVDILRKAGADAVVAIGSYAACAGFIRDARDQGWDVPIANVSFVGSENLLVLLLQLSESAGKDYTGNLVNSQVVPYYEQGDLEAVQEYREAMRRFDPRPAPALVDDDYEPVPVGPASFEGFLNAKLMAEILRRADDPTDPGDLRGAAHSVRTVDLGIGVPVSFSSDDHEGIETVYFTTVEDGRFVPLDDWSPWRLE